MIITAALDNWLAAALCEDIGTGDVTSEAIIKPGMRGKAEVIAKQELVIAGLTPALRCFSLLDKTVILRALKNDGENAKPFEALAAIEGNVQALLAAERTFLNVLQHLCGIATLTARFVAAVSCTKARIVDTRKTLPGIRALEKYAVRMGGGVNHRMGLYDHILIKDNHIKAAGGVTEAVTLAKYRVSFLGKVEVEVKDLLECEKALAAGADIIMLDNFKLDEIKNAAALVAGRAMLEVSGGVTIDRVAELAQTGVDIISVGALTHSAPAADISLELVSIEGNL